MKTVRNPLMTLDDLLIQLRKYAPWIPAIIAAQVLSSLLADTPPVKNNWLLHSVFGKGLAIPAFLLLGAVALKDMRDSTTDEFRNELKNYVGISKSRTPDSPFTIRKTGGHEQDFPDLDRLAGFLAEMRVTLNPDRASRSFDAARRTVISGWSDPYILRAAELLAIRSIEQSMHELFPDKKSQDRDWVTSLNKTRDDALNTDGTPKKGAESLANFMRAEIPEIGNLYDLFGDVIAKRHHFAHRDDGDGGDVFCLDLAPFQLARACLLYRNQPRP